MTHRWFGAATGQIGTPVPSTAGSGIRVLQRHRHAPLLTAPPAAAHTLTLDICISHMLHRRMMMTYRTKALDLEGLRSELDVLDPDAPVAVGVLDLDGFGRVNDEQGQEAGDELLARIEARLVDGMPPGAIVAHLRVDEFAVALPEEPPEALLLALDAVRRGVEDAEPVTMSAGVAGRPHHGASSEELLSAADSALVRSKREGANRVSIAVAERMVLKTSYYSPSALHRLAKLARRTGRPEASLLREALDDLLAKHRDLL
jgi:diguanylate cyclase